MPTIKPRDNDLPLFNKTDLKKPKDGKEIQTYGRIRSFLHKLNFFSSTKWEKIQVQDGGKIKIRKIKARDLSRIDHLKINHVRLSAGLSAPTPAPLTEEQLIERAWRTNSYQEQDLPWKSAQQPSEPEVQQVLPALQPQAQEPIVQPQVQPHIGPQAHQVSQKMLELIEQTKKPRFGEPKPEVLEAARAAIVDHLNNRTYEVMRNPPGVETPQTVGILAELMIEGRLFGYSSQRNNQFLLFDSKESFENYKIERTRNHQHADMICSIEDLKEGALDMIPWQA